MEKTNIRYVTPEDIGELVDFVSIDVAFISLTKVLEPVKTLMKEGASMVCLIKPQFEAGREKVGKKGVVRDPAVHRDVIESIISYAGSLGFTVCGLDFSPIRGPEGNIEYLLYIKKDNQEFGGISQEQKEEIRQIVEDAQEHAVKHAGDLDV